MNGGQSGPHHIKTLNKNISMSHREIVKQRMKLRNDRLDRRIISDIATIEINQAAIDAHVNKLNNLSNENNNI
jgi:hypothetical protein